jgi:ribonuclease T2
MRRLVALLFLLLARPLVAAPPCTPPAQVAAPYAVGATVDEPARQAPVTGYTLALSWAPEYCHGRHGAADVFDCGGALAHGFTLHGLWPDAAYPKAWPEYCRPATVLPEAVLRANLCMTPSAQLLQHEWAKHGVCMAATPESYFATASAAVGAVRFPAMAELARDRGLTVAALQKAFAAANQGAPPQAYAVKANRAGWLEEVHVCLGLDMRARACPAGAGGADPTARVRIEAGAAGYRSSRSPGGGDRDGGG